MIDKINEIIKEVGRPYEDFDENGHYIGCFYPVYRLYPHLKRYKLRTNDKNKQFNYCLSKMRKNFEFILQKDAKVGDVIMTDIKGIFHVGLFLGYGKILHLFKGGTLQIGKIKQFRNHCFCRIK